MQLILLVNRAASFYTRAMNSRHPQAFRIMASSDLRNSLYYKITHRMSEDAVEKGIRHHKLLSNRFQSSKKEELHSEGRAIKYK